MNGRAILRRLLPILLVAAGAADAVAATATVRALVFEAGLLAGVSRPLTLRYTHLLSGTGMNEPYRSEARMEIREVRADGRKLVWFDMFDGPNHRAFGPMPVVDQNPIVLVFLQRDVMTMANLTGGAAGYFQQQIRNAFGEPVEAETVRIQWQGREVEARRLLLRPFANDPQIDRFPQFRDKSYEFVVAPELPGGLYRIASQVPDPNGGGAVLEESLTLEAVE